MFKHLGNLRVHSEMVPHLAQNVQRDDTYLLLIYYAQTNNITLRKKQIGGVLQVSEKNFII